MPTEEDAANRPAAGWYQRELLFHEYMRSAWRSLAKDTKRNLWPDIRRAESPASLERVLRGLMSQEGRVVRAGTGEDGEAGKSYYTFRAAKALHKTGFVLTPTNNLLTTVTDLFSG